MPIAGYTVAHMTAQSEIRTLEKTLGTAQVELTKLREENVELRNNQRLNESMYGPQMDRWYMSEENSMPDYFFNQPYQKLNDKGKSVWKPLTEQDPFEPLLRENEKR